MINLTEKYPRLVEQTTDTICKISNNYNTEQFFYYFWLPLIVGLLSIVFILMRERLKLWFDRKLLGRGYIKIIVKDNNENLVNKMIKLDKNNMFVFRNRRFSLEKMKNVIFGYIDGVPIYFYDKNFVFPLTLTREKVNKSIKEAYKYTSIDLTEEEITAIALKIDSRTVEQVYSRKLLSDLYSTSMDSDLMKWVIWVLGGLGLIIFLYYTGYLDSILSYFQ